MTSWLDIVADLRAHTGRNVLTAVSLFLGVFAVMAIIVTGDVVKEVFVATAEQQGGRFQTFERRVALADNPDRSAILGAITSLPRSAEAVTACTLDASSNVQVAVAPQSNPVTQQATDAGTSVTFVCGDYRSAYRLPISAGHWFADDLATSPYEAVVNKAAAHALGGPGTVVWLISDATATAFPVTVIGVVNDGPSQPRLLTRSLPWITNAPELLTPTALTLIWQQAGASPDQVTSATSDWLIDHGLPIAGEVLETDTVAGYQQFILVVQWSYAGVAALSLLVAALGIINVGLASVRERSHELVIRRAIGASKLSIVRMIVGSSLLLSIIVAAISSGAAWIALIVFRSTVAYDSPIQPPAYPVSAAVIGTAVSITTALLGSIIPGLRAAHLQPGMALRE